MKVPKIRFKGFTDDWEQCKLGEISDVRDGTHDSPKYLNTGHPFVTSKNVKDGFINYDEIHYISDEDFNEINKRSKVDVNDILMGMIGTIGNMALIRTEPDFAIKNVALIKDTKQINYLYLYHFLHSPFVKKQLSFGLDGGTQKFLSLGNVRNLNIVYPLDAEQIKLGDYFDHLDHLITLHQRKCEQLKKIKKYMLQNMFPENEEKVPKIRFKGFTGDWEQRKLQKIAERYDNLRIPVKESDRILGNTPYYGANGIQDYVEGFTHDGEFILIAEDGANDLNDYPVHYVNGKVWVNNHAHVIQAIEGVSSNKFIQYSFKTFNIEPYLVGGSRAKLNANIMMDLVIKTPSLSEQEKIGTFFSNLDNLTTLHQRKCELLKKLKKYMLQNMFPVV